MHRNATGTCGRGGRSTRLTSPPRPDARSTCCSHARGSPSRRICHLEAGGARTSPSRECTPALCAKPRDRAPAQAAPWRSPSATPRSPHHFHRLERRQARTLRTRTRRFIDQAIPRAARLQRVSENVHRAVTEGAAQHYAAPPGSERRRARSFGPQRGVTPRRYGSSPCAWPRRGHRRRVPALPRSTLRGDRW